ncbi:MAG: hypothetical protein KGJ43_08230, partial [Acidobacteriota bacterium]|nr:hypothetical protein [Acidobacteriota bacterium]
GAALGTLAALLLADGSVASRPAALAMFCCGAFALAVVAGELARGTRARMAIAGEAPPMAALGLVRRNRRRYGGYTVHVGIALLFIGVAASSSFQHQTERSLGPGQTARVGRYNVRYLRPTAAVINGPDRTGATVDLGAVLEIRRGGRRVGTLRPMEGYYASDEPSQGSVGYLIGGQPVSHISMDSGLGGDVWSAIEPNIHSAALQRVVEAGNRIVPAGHYEDALAALWVLAHDYVKAPPAAQFNLITLPLVEWIWLGGLVALLGALLAIWPSPLALRARVRALAPGSPGAAGEPAGA